MSLRGDRPAHTLRGVSTTADFFISYTGKDRAWAEWIAWVLEAANYRAILQAWDFKAASNFIFKMQQAATDSARTIAVLSPDYFESGFTRAEWAVAFAADAGPQDGKLIPVRIVDFEPPGYFKIINYIDLVGVEEGAAQERLVGAIKSIVQGTRLKPDTKPAFPGGAAPRTPAVRPPFPGTKTQREFVHNLPFRPNPFFTGRDQLLMDLHDTLHRQTAAAITQPQTVHGLGGVGKTQLAVEYAWKYQTDYDAILWAGAGSRTDLHANVATLATVLRLPEAEATQQEARVAGVVDWLEAHRRWLLILDNADTLEAKQAVETLLPPALAGHVIVTSRLGNWGLGFADLEVRVLAPEAAEKFLLERAQKAHFDAGPAADARAMAQDLGCLPLALENAAAYVVERCITFAEYRRRLVQSRPRLLEFPNQGGTGYQRTVAKTWLVTGEQLSRRARAVAELRRSLLGPREARASFRRLRRGGWGKARRWRRPWRSWRPTL